MAAAHPLDYGPHRGPMDREDRRTRMLLLAFALAAIVVVTLLVTYLRSLG